jgi:hypothetical protein
MTEDMNIVLKPKFSDFIKIIDDMSKDETNNIQINTITIIPTTYQYITEPQNIDEPIMSSKLIFEKLHSLISSPKKSQSIQIIEETQHSETVSQQSGKMIIRNIKKTEKEKEKETKVEVEMEKGKDNIKNSKKKKPKKNELIDEKQGQHEKLELLYEKEIYKDKSLEKPNKTPKDQLKQICNQFENNCIMEATRGFSVKDDIYYINIELLKKHIIDFNRSIPENYECSILYRNYKDNKILLNANKNIGWLEISKTGEKFITSKNKLLSSSLRLFEKTNKYRKTFDTVKVRAFKISFLIYKTNIKVDIFALTKYLLNKK